MIVLGDEFEDVIKFNYTTPRRKKKNNSQRKNKV